MEPVSSSNVFSDNNIDVELGAVLFKELKVGDDILYNPGEMSKLREISEFFSNHPDPFYAIGKTIRSNQSPNISNLDHLYTYTQLEKERNSLMDKLDKINNDLKFYG